MRTEVILILAVAVGFLFLAKSRAMREEHRVGEALRAFEAAEQAADAAQRQRIELQRRALQEQKERKK